MTASTLKAPGPVMVLVSLRERILEVMQAAGLTQAGLARVCEVTDSAVNQWLGGNKQKEIKSIQLRPALMLERKTGFSALWISKGEGPKRVAVAPRIRPEWPFRFVDRDDYMALDDQQRAVAEKIKDLSRGSGKQDAA